MDLSGERRAVERPAMSLSTGRTERYAAVNDEVKIGLRYCRKLNGQYALDGQITLNGGILYAA
jgi:hypothetical protein